MSQRKIILVQDRDDNYHLVDFCAPISGRKYTLCEQIYAKKTIINTFTIDDSFPGLCDKCQEVYNREYSCQSLNNRLSKGSLHEDLLKSYGQARTQSSDREYGYMDRASRIWDKLGRYKRKLRNDLRK